MTQETDPNGKNAHEPGAKLDSGKPRMNLVLGGFARALIEVAKVGTFGAKKYTDNGWKSVPNGIERYSDAGPRHRMYECMGEKLDPESKLHHAAHEAWNALARLELILIQEELETKYALERVEKSKIEYPNIISAQSEPKQWTMVDQFLGRGLLLMGVGANDAKKGK